MTEEKKEETAALGIKTDGMHHVYKKYTRIEWGCLRKAVKLPPFAEVAHPYYPTTPPWLSLEEASQGRKNLFSVMDSVHEVAKLGVVELSTLNKFRATYVKYCDHITQAKYSPLESIE